MCRLLHRKWLELPGVEREAPVFALMGEIGTRKYVGSAFTDSSRAMVSPIARAPR
ncbi:hypothetical protein [Mesorhizobium temperatum]|uniref:hypothetical protein n=1 Tax=Mesorhizobium temperatum TaxID=241416 RepID=UPI001FDA70A0|nr:hypothetical protein [Mesorhizobium temperatum]